MKWLAGAGAVGIAYCLGIRRGENSALKALCIALNGRDDRIYFLLRRLHEERVEFKEQYRELESLHLGLTSLIRLISSRIAEGLSGMPQKTADLIIPLLEALDSASD